jgi:hydrogenase nickel incorporation protein HypA/HybF
MHELPVTESILNIALKHASKADVKKIISISLKVGEMSDLEDEWIQKYFDYLSKDTMAEGAKLRIERVPVTMRCNSCSEVYQVNIRENGDFKCPACSCDSTEMVSGREYHVKDMEVI